MGTHSREHSNSVKTQRAGLGWDLGSQPELGSGEVVQGVGEGSERGN